MDATTTSRQQFNLNCPHEPLWAALSTATGKTQGSSATPHVAAPVSRGVGDAFRSRPEASARSCNRPADR